MTSVAVSVRRAVAADAGSLAALRRAWTEEDGGGPVDDAGFESRFEAWFSGEQSPMWMAVRAGSEPVGMATLRLVHRMPEPGRGSERWGYVGHVYVVPAERDQGIGRLLMEALIGWSRAEGLTRLVLHPRARSLPFYGRLGFTDAQMLRLRLRP